MASMGFSFVPFKSIASISTTQIEKSEDVVLGIRTQDCKMVCADVSSELWRSFDILAAIFKRKGYTKYNVM